MTKKTKIVLSILLGLGIGTLIWYFTRNSNKGLTEEELAKKLADEAAALSAKTGTKANIPNTDAGELVEGSKGMRVEALQKKLGIVVTNAPYGFLGTRTKAAIEVKGYSLPLSSIDYNNLMSGKTKTSNIVGSKVWAIKDTPMWKDALADKVVTTFKRGDLVGVVENIGNIKGFPHAKMKGAGYVAISSLSQTDPKVF